MNSKIVRILLWLVLAALAGPAGADEKEDLENLRNTTVNLLRLLVREGVLSQDKADALIKEAQKKSAPESVAASKATDGPAKDSPAQVVRVPYVPEVVRNEIRDQIKQEVLAQAKTERWGDPGAVPEWLDRIALDAELRLRAESDMYPKGNAPATFFQSSGQNINNTTNDQDRFRVRARIGLQVKATDWLSGGIRITTGSLTDPVSTNQTLGNYNDKYQANFDLAYLKAEPYKWLTFAGGRIPNPWFGTDLVWNDSLTFEGAALTVKPALTPRANAFLTIGAFPVQQIEQTPTTLAPSKWLYGAQTGFELTSKNDSRFKFGVALYDYRNVEGIPNTFNSNLYDQTAPLFRQKGNSLFDLNAANIGLGQASIYGLAPKYREFNVTGAVDLAAWDPVHVVLTGDFVRNVGFDRSEIFQRTGLDINPQITGYSARLMVGSPRLQRAGEWQAFLGYKYLESDAVLDAFTDSDFHLGGTNTQGYYVGVNYGVARNSWIGLRWLTANQISGAPLAIDVLQLDFNARF